MSDDSFVGQPAGVNDESAEQLSRNDDAIDLDDPSATDVAKPPARARLQSRLNQTRTTVRDASARARNSAALTSRRPAQPFDETDDAAPVTTLAQRAQAYRPYLLSAAGAVAAALVLALLRRVRGRNSDDAIDLGEWHLLAQPIDE